MPPAERRGAAGDARGRGEAATDSSALTDTDEDAPPGDSAEYGGLSDDTSRDTDSTVSCGARQQRPGRASSEPPPARRRPGGGLHPRSQQRLAGRRRGGHDEVSRSLSRWEQRLRAREAQLTARAQEVQRLLLRVKAQAARTVADAADVEATRLELRRRMPSTQHGRLRDSSTGKRGAARPVAAPHVRRSTPGSLLGLARRGIVWVLYILCSATLMVGIMCLVRPPPALVARQKHQRPIVRVTDRMPDML
jgi:hypothetical protein